MSRRQISARTYSGSRFFSITHCSIHRGRGCEQNSRSRPYRPVTDDAERNGVMRWWFSEFPFGKKRTKQERFAFLTKGNKRAFDCERLPRANGFAGLGAVSRSWRSRADWSNRTLGYSTLPAVYYVSLGARLAATFFHPTRRRDRTANVNMTATPIACISAIDEIAA